MQAEADSPCAAAGASGHLTEPIPAGSLASNPARLLERKQRRPRGAAARPTILGSVTCRASPNLAGRYFFGGPRSSIWQSSLNDPMPIAGADSNMPVPNAVGPEVERAKPTQGRLTFRP